MIGNLIIFNISIRVKRCSFHVPSCQEKEKQTGWIEKDEYIFVKV